jgi:hypothetical protein
MAGGPSTEIVAVRTLEDDRARRMVSGSRTEWRRRIMAYIALRATDGAWLGVNERI